jgi:outer membrane assembly lipoprotein YfiO
MRLNRFLLPAAFAAILASCSDSTAPPLAGTDVISNAKAETLYQQATSAESAGKRNKAIKYYKKLAEDAPISKHGADARFRQAQLLEEKGDPRGAFDAYQEFLERYNGSGLYEKALKRQAAIAQDAVDGKVTTSFFGLKSSISTDKIAEMLAKVRANAPRSPLASQALFNTGKLWESKGDADSAAKAIDAYRELANEYPDSKEAPEGSFRIGKILMAQARQGNQDEANLDRARESFQDFLRLYPNHPKAGEARKMLSTISGQDVQRSLNIAKFYQQKGDLNSARFYYEEVLRKQAYGPLHDEAKAGLAKLGH